MTDHSGMFLFLHVCILTQKLCLINGILYAVWRGSVTEYIGCMWQLASYGTSEMCIAALWQKYCWLGKCKLKVMLSDLPGAMWRTWRSKESNYTYLHVQYLPTLGNTHNQENQYPILINPQDSLIWFKSLSLVFDVIMFKRFTPPYTPHLQLNGNPGTAQHIIS